VGRVAFKEEGDPLWMATMSSHSPHALRPSTFRAPRTGSACVAFVLLSLEEHSFAEVGTFQPSLGFKDFHQAVRLHPLADGHPRR
jgi:hypothetical protein